MSTLGTFDAFTSARLGIYAAQQGLSVTGNNISNINTVGYTRQRLDQVSFKAGAYDRYRSQLDNHVGSGALVMNINQVRDPYLDVRFRNTNADVGFNATMLDGLKQIADILDEVGVGDDTNVNKKGDGRLQKQIQAVSDALRKYSKEPTKQNNDLVRQAADSLCGILNSYATKLENLRKETEQDFEAKVDEVNEILLNIRDLNDEIRDNEIFGDNALELRDERNRQIDKLSELIHITVTYSEEDVGAGRKVEKLTIALDNDNPDPNIHSDSSLLVDGVYATQLLSPEKLPKENPLYDLEKALQDPTQPAGPNNQYDPEAQPFAFRYLTTDRLTKEDPVGTIKYAYWDKAAKEIVYDTDPDLADGNDDLEIVYKGTNDIKDEKLDTYENNNYGIMLDKLRDELGKEWEKKITEWKEAEDGTIATRAVYKYQVTTTTWADGNSVDISGETYTIKDDGTGDITSADANDPVKFAKFVADRLKSDDYTVSSVGDEIRFTAKKAGAIGTSGPATSPKITFTTPTGGANGNITLDPPSGTEAAVVTPGVETVPPTTPAAGTTPNEDGSVTTVTHRINNGQWYAVTTVTYPTTEVTLDDNDLYGSLQATRELLTEEGEFASEADKAIDEDATKKRGIPFYQQYLDLFAYQFATEYNKLNQGYCYNQNGNYIDEDNVELELAGKPVSKTDGLTAEQEKALIDDGCVLEDGTTPDLNRWLEAKNAKKPDGEGVLFSNRNDRDWTGNPDKDGSLDAENPKITASNISISHSWSTGDVVLVPKFEVLWGDDENPDGMDHTTQNTNADHMVTLIDTATKIHFNPQDIAPDAISSKLFVGSFNGMYNDMCTTLGEKQDAVNVAMNMHATQLVEIDTARDGVSGVDLNDEAMNMMSYQKAYSAACRLMTVVDEMLDRLINNTGIAGR